MFPELPKNSIVGLWFGANSESITLTGDIKDCINGLSSTDIFGQVAFCNTHKFFQAVQIAKSAGKVTIPRLGEDPNGDPCPTTRFFGIIDQDQSDNVLTTYLQSKGGRFAQATKANRKKLNKFTEIANGSDNALVADILDPVRFFFLSLLAFIFLALVRFCPLFLVKLTTSLHVLCIQYPIGAQMQALQGPIADGIRRQAGLNGAQRTPRLTPTAPRRIDSRQRPHGPLQQQALHHKIKRLPPRRQPAPHHQPQPSNHEGLLHKLR